ncbi:MAG: hypothetical protein JWL91_1952 [Sphingomonas bacterium]|nr:hypothetical protein [Sphingomonas bacterium]MDB5690076.1 hypothetical protein [Sphingomonas bacterium]
MTEPTRKEKDEAAAVRRRWINLGEVLAVVAVGISGLTLWNSYSERSHAEAEKAGAEKRASAKAATLLLRAVPSKDGDRLTLAPIGAEQSIQSQIVAFPTPLGIAAVDTTGDARIEAEWLEDGLKKARRAAERKDETIGDEQVPVAITSQFIADGEPHSDVALYDLGYALDGRLIGGSRLRLRGLSRIARATPGTAQARIDAMWSKRQPRSAPAAKPD